MSKTIISVERVNDVKPHPNADRLEIVQILGYNVITQKGLFSVGDKAIYFPPDILLHPIQSKPLGVTNYLKHAIFPGDIEKTQCRVGATRLRGVPSHGFCVPLDQNKDSNVGLKIGTDITSVYGAQKYVPPVRLSAGDSKPELSAFHKYTSIENLQRYPDAFKLTDTVVITEKIHGTNCRLGLVRDDGGEFIFCAGSHNVNRKEGGLYWEFMTEEVMLLLSELADENHGHHDVVVFGEIFGPGIQDMDYGRSDHTFRVFDISVDGRYLNYWDMITVCDVYGLLAVPMLYAGPYSPETVESCTYGKSTFGDIQCKFKDREGCVVRPVIEAYSDVLGGRLVGKSVSADYRDRKGAKDIGE